MRRRARVDGNHAEIVAAFRRLGWYVHDTHGLGDGFPDLVIAKHGLVVLVEVKDGNLALSRRALTKDELRVRTSFAGAGVLIQIVTSIDEVLELDAANHLGVLHTKWIQSSH